MLKPLVLERYTKGFASHNRIRIMLLLERSPDLSLLDIASGVKLNIKTAGEHTRRLGIAGIIMKRHSSQRVEHALTKRGEMILKFLRTLE